MVAFGKEKSLAIFSCDAPFTGYSLIHVEGFVVLTHSMSHSLLGKMRRLRPFVPVSCAHLALRAPAVCYLFLLTLLIDYHWCDLDEND